MFAVHEKPKTQLLLQPEEINPYAVLESALTTNVQKSTTIKDVTRTWYGGFRTFNILLSYKPGTELASFTSFENCPDEGDGKLAEIAVTRITYSENLDIRSLRRMFNFMGRFDTQDGKPLKEFFTAKDPTYNRHKVLENVTSGDISQLPCAVTEMGRLAGVFINAADMPAFLATSYAMWSLLDKMSNKRAGNFALQNISLNGVLYYAGNKVNLPRMRKANLIYLKNSDQKFQTEFYQSLHTGEIDVSWSTAIVGLDKSAPTDKVAAKVHAIYIPIGYFRWYCALRQKLFEDMLTPAMVAAMPPKPEDWQPYLEEIARRVQTAKDITSPNTPEDEPEDTPTAPPSETAPATQVKDEDGHAPRVPKAPHEKPPKPARLPTGTLLGLDALAVLQKVLASPDGFFTCEIDATAEVLPEYKPPVTVKERRTPSRKIRNQPEEPRLVDLKEALVRSKIAVMEASRFKHIVDNWRYAGTHLLERMLGRELHFDRVNMVDITPAQIGLVPTIVAGLHRPRRDRLGTARLSLMYRAEGDDEEKLHTLVFYPSGWMSPVAEVWMTGLFGTPVDPTLLDFCKTLSPEWWTDLAKVIPPKGDAPPMLDIRTLQP